MQSPITSSAWDIVKHEIKAHISSGAFDLWIKPVVFVSATPRSITLGAPNDLVAILVHDTYLKLIKGRVASLVGYDVAVEVRKQPGSR